VSASSSDELTMTAVTLRRLGRPEAPGVTRLVTLVYEDGYYPRDLYDPEQIVRLNEAGRLVSVVAVNSVGDVVGHYALERPQLGAIAEASDAIVQPDYRHHHLLEQMRILLREEAIREGLTGLVGYAVTNHTFTQKAEQHFGAHPCGLALGLWPRSFHNMPEPLTQRMSFAIYFKFLRRPARVVHVATHHREMIARIYQQYDIPVQLREDEPVAGTGVVVAEYDAALETGTVRVYRMGADTAAAIRQACWDLCEGSGAKALTLEIPMSQSGAAAVCLAAEVVGFFFSGLGPAFAGEEDVLLLQLLREDLDLSQLQIEQPFARELLTYVAGERERVGNARWH
jgi:hypothetical protein